MYKRKLRLLRTRLKRYSVPAVIFFFAAAVTAAAMVLRHDKPTWEVTVHVLETLAVVGWLHFFERIALWKEISSWYGERLESVLASFSGTSDVGITRVFRGRAEAIRNIVEDLPLAKKRIWLLGIALTNDLTLEKHIGTIGKLHESLAEYVEHQNDKSSNSKVGGNRETDSDSGVRILLLDPLCYAAAFRSLIESDPKQFAFEVTDPRSILQHSLFRKVSQTVESIRAHKNLQYVTRFYTSDPSCWLILIDNVAYYQPYTLGWNPKEPRADDLSIGPYFPVFKVRGQSNLFEMLQDHFKKLWLVSDVSYLYHAARQPREKAILRKLLSERKRAARIRMIHSALYASGEKAVSHDGRSSPRCLCESDLESVAIQWKHTPLKGRVIDFSSTGLFVEVFGKAIPRNGDTVRLTIPEGLGPALETVARHYSTHCENRFVVKRATESRIALHVSPPAPA